MSYPGQFYDNKVPRIAYDEYGDIVKRENPFFSSPTFNQNQNNNNQYINNISKKGLDPDSYGST